MLIDLDEWGGAVPETGHYCEILDIIGDTIRGRQSNVDSIQIWAELLL